MKHLESFSFDRAIDRAAPQRCQLRLARVVDEAAGTVRILRCGKAAVDVDMVGRHLCRSHLNGAIRRQFRPTKNGSVPFQGRRFSRVRRLRGLLKQLPFVALHPITYVRQAWTAWRREARQRALARRHLRSLLLPRGIN